MRTVLLVGTILLTAAGVGLTAPRISAKEDPVLLATCTGSDSCRACKNCKYCKHCKSGGTCGVCK